MSCVIRSADYHCTADPRNSRKDARHAKRHETSSLTGRDRRSCCAGLMVWRKADTQPAADQLDILTYEETVVS